MTEYSPSGPGLPGKPFGAEPMGADALFREYWRRLVQHRWVVVGCTAFVVVLSMIVTFLATPQYTATATLEIRRLAPDIVEFRDVLPIDPWGYNDFYQTQYNILQSRAVSRLAVEQVDLVSQPEYATRKPSPIRRFMRWALPDPGPDGEEDGGEYTPLDAATDFLQKRLAIQPVRNSHLCYISVTDKSAKLAAELANALAASYQNFALSELYETTGNARNFLIRDVARVRGEIAKLQQRMQDYGVEQEILALSDGGLDISERALEETNLRYTAAKNRLATAEAAYQAVKDATPEGMPEVANSPVITHLSQRQAELERQISQMSGRFAPEWPPLMQVREELAKADQQLQSTSESIANQVRAAARVDFARTQGEVRNLEVERDQLKVEVQRVKQVSIEYAGLQAEIETKREVLATLVSRESETDTTYRLKDMGASNVRVVDVAQAPAKPSYPNKRRRLAFSTLVGLLLGTGLALLIGYLDNTIKSEADVQQIARVGVLGRVPLTRSLTIPQPKVIDSDVMTHQLDLATHFDPRSQFSEAFKSIRTSFLLASPNGPSRTIAITSCQSGDGKSTVALNLAIVLTQLGRSVLLIDGDLRRPRIHKTLSLENRNGLSNLLSGNARLADITQTIDVPGLTIVPSGPSPPNPSELLGSRALAEFVDWVSDNGDYDHVLFDCTPVLTVTDAALLATRVDSTILLARAGVTARDALRQSVARLRELRINVMGVILNAALEDSGYYYYQYEPGESEPMGVARAVVAKLKRRRAG